MILSLMSVRIELKIHKIKVMDWACSPQNRYEKFIEDCSSKARRRMSLVVRAREWEDNIKMCP
jgi:hypothetical protein